MITNPWFWLVISTLLFRRFLTGWFAPLWPNFIFFVLALRAIANNWWPRQIPNTGNPLFIISFIIFTAYFPVAAGSPGPLDKKTPLGLIFRISSTVVWQGTIVTSHEKFEKYQNWSIMMLYQTILIRCIWHYQMIKKKLVRILLILPRN